MVTTIAAMDLIAKALEQKIRAIQAESKEEQDKQVNKVLGEFVTIMRHLRNLNHTLLPLVVALDEDFTQEKKSEYISGMISWAEKNTRLELVATGVCNVVVVGRLAFSIPKYVDFTKQPHVLISPSNSDVRWEGFAVRMMNQLVLGCMMSMPRGKVRVNIINLQWSDKANELNQNLPESLCQVFLEEEETKLLLEKMADRIKTFLKTGKIAADEPAVELIVLLDYPKGYDSLTGAMRMIIEKGAQAGIHLIVLKGTRGAFKPAVEKPFDILELREQYFQEFGVFMNVDKENYDYVLSYIYELREFPWLQQACFDYLKGIPVQMKQHEDVHHEDEHHEVSSGEEHVSMSDSLGDLSVSVGKNEEGVPIGFMLDTISHVHAFVLGQSGSGKSVFLHSVLIELIKRYRPSDLCLYLLDFKLGGVEFNRYRDVKHVKALLVDNSDIQITLEILRDLINEMTERGKRLREAGVSDVTEYNQKYPDQHLSQILFVADECHELFNMQGRGSRMVKQEIQTIITKIAKEGRSQGVHLLLATQTLAGAEISNEILNNITDHYLLKCSIADSERMVRDSSRMTANQQVGQVYYHHTESQYQFLSTYMPKEQLDKTIQDIVSKTSDMPSNGQFYFSGAQIFNIDASVVESVGSKQGNNPVAVLGRGISLKQEPLGIVLKRDFSENILLFGIDEDRQVTRTTMAALLSLMMSYKQKGINAQIKVIDCGNDEDADYIDILDCLEDDGLCQVIERRERASELKKLAESIANETAIPTILVVIGQERFRELKLNMEIKDSTEPDVQAGSNEGIVDVFAGLNFSSSLFGDKKKIDVSNFEKAMRYILENGPEQGVHTVLQIDKPSKLLFQEFVSSKVVFSMFKHIVMLRSEEKTAMTLGLSDDIRLEDLSSEQERLRAYYYSEEDDSYQLFSPYTLPTKKELDNILKQL